MTPVPSRFSEASAPAAPLGDEALWDVRLFGPFRVLQPGGANATPSGRKARALLAFLVLADGAATPRERLCALLWSERGEDQARASLRQTLYEIRALTGGEAPPLVVDRTGVRIAPERVTSDRVRINAATDATSLAALLGERPAELLVDLDGVDPAFDDWLAAERVRQSGARRRQALEVGGRALVACDASGAYRLAIRLLACDPTDEAAARLAMEASHREGDRDAVRRTFGDVRTALRDELGADPADETVALYERLMVAAMPSRAGQASTAMQAANDDPPRDTADAPPPPSPPGPAAARPDGRREAGRPATPRRTHLVLPLLAVALAVAAAAIWFVRSSSPAPVTRTLVVRPFTAAPDDPAALALRAGLSADLARLLVGNAGTLSVVDASQAPRVASTSTFTIDGEARSDARLLHATVHLSHDRDGPILWSGTFARPIGDVDGLREEIASKVDDIAVCALGRDNPRAARFGDEAMRLMLAICAQSHLKASAEHVKLLEQLLVLEPDFARGWGWLAAERQYIAPDLPADAAAIKAEAEQDAQRALALDPHDGEAYLARAIGLDGIGHWAERMHILLRGHALDPANGDLDGAIADDLQAVGRWHEAAVFYQREIDADPFSAYAEANRIQLLALGGSLVDTTEAVEALGAARKRFGSHRAIAFTDLEVNALVGDPRRALAILEDPARGFPLRPDRIALWNTLATARAAPSPENDAKIERFLTTAPTSQLEVFLALQTLGRHDRVDEAYAYIEGLGSELGERLSTAELFNSLTRSLRDDPRFMTVAARAGLVSIWRATDHWPDFCSGPAVRYDCRAEAARAMSPAARPLVGGR